MRTITEIQLIQKALQGDKTAFSQLVKPYYPQVCAFIEYKIGYSNSKDSMDLTQEVFVSAYEDLAKLKNRGNFCGWLLGIAKNKASDYLRLQKGNPTTLSWDELETTAPSCPFSDFVIVCFFSHLREAFTKLTPQQQLVWLLRWEEWSNPEIEAEYGIPHDSVKAEWFKARKAVNTYISEHYGVSEDESNMLTACTKIYYPSIWEQLWTLLEARRLR